MLFTGSLAQFIEDDAPSPDYPREDYPDHLSCDYVERICVKLRVVTFGSFAPTFGELGEDITRVFCSINFERQDEMRKLEKRSHIFREDCFDKWLQHYHNSCPPCRFLVLLSWLLDEEQQRTGTEPVESPPEPKSSVELVTLESASGVVAGKDELQLPAQKSRALSPYPMYEDLKPPTSPTPSAPNLSYKVESPSEHRFSLEPVMLGSGVFSKKEEPQLPLQKAKPLSPYPMYEDFKPPSSPSPTSPSKQIFAAEAVELPSEPRLSMESVVLESAPCIIAEKKESQLHPQKSRPLSPYPMYEDLKPPTSPSPTLRLF